MVVILQGNYCTELQTDMLEKWTNALRPQNLCCYEHLVVKERNTLSTIELLEYAIPPLSLYEFPNGGFWVSKWRILSLSAPKGCEG